MIVKLMYDVVKNTTRSRMFCEADYDATIVLDANGDQKADLLCNHPDAKNYDLVYSVHPKGQLYFVAAPKPGEETFAPGQEYSRVGEFFDSG